MPSSSSCERSHRTKQRALKRIKLDLTSKFALNTDEVPTSNVIVDDEIVHAVAAEVEICSCDTATVDLPSKEISMQTDSVTAVQTHDTTTQTSSSSNLLSVDRFISDDTAFHFYTGLHNYDIFRCVLRSLGPAAYQLQYLYGRNPTLDIQNLLFLTLIKCRLYKTNFELSTLFGVSVTDVYAIFVTWIKFMSLQWRELNMWPDRETVDFFAPFDFKQKFPSTRVIVDGTEIPIKKPSPPAAQQVTFSSYKNKNTAKSLIGITPGGLVSYVSDAYGGSASDRQIVERSHLIDTMDPGDSVMADKGFDVQDLFAPYDVTVNIPTFFRKRNKIASKTVLHDRKIASKRVHVERVIGVAKTYTILTNSLTQTESLLSSHIIFVCFMLVNYRKCIVSRCA